MNPFKATLIDKNNEHIASVNAEICEERRIGQFWISSSKDIREIRISEGFLETIEKTRFKISEINPCLAFHMKLIGMPESDSRHHFEFTLEYEE
jgi:hypothetical protein